MFTKAPNISLTWMWRGKRSRAMPCARLESHVTTHGETVSCRSVKNEILSPGVPPVTEPCPPRDSWLSARLARTSHFKWHKVFLPWVQQSLTSIKLNLMASHWLGPTCVTLSQVSMNLVNLSQIKILRQWRRCWNYRIVLNFPFILYGPKYLQLTIIYCCMKHLNNDKSFWN